MPQNYVIEDQQKILNELVSYFQSLYNDENTLNEHKCFEFIKKIAGTIH